ncbi:MAG: 23S rRNA (adenine(2503)-C(2))-methyltransferase RlmN [Patescibacteria group bacterium]
MNISKLSKILAAEPKFRWQQINQALFQDYISNWNEASNLSKALREKLAAECPLEIKAKIFKSTGDQKSEKALITLEDGEKIETVLIRQRGSGSAAGRCTVCISSQAGCPLGCTFCATGAAGFQRNLKAEEIVEQVIFWARYLKKENAHEKIDNIVFMGMGEPFLNYAEFIKAAKFLNNPETLNIGARRLSVSTAGLTDGIKRLAGEKLQMNLAISLHAPDDALRQELMPIAKKYPLKEIFKAVDDYIHKTGRRVMFEYLMIKGVNDRDNDALALVELLHRPLYLLNLIPYNSIGTAGKFKSSERTRIEEFKKILETKGVPVTVRMSFGGEISAACGQLSRKRR